MILIKTCFLTISHSCHILCVVNETTILGERPRLIYTRRQAPMALLRWTPISHLPSFQYEMNRMVNEFFGGNGEAAGTALSSWTPAVDIHETDDGYVIKAELP